MFHRRVHRAVLDILRQLKVAFETTKGSIVHHVLGAVLVASAALLVPVRALVHDVQHAVLVHAHLDHVPVRAGDVGGDDVLASLVDDVVGKREVVGKRANRVLVSKRNPGDG